MRKDNLAFSGGSSSTNNLVKSSGRDPFRTSDGYELNVEVFGTDIEHPMVLFIHGICESAETWTVQTIAQFALKNEWRVAVLELMGHGLSSGRRAVCGSFPQLQQHVMEFINHMALSGDNKPKFVLSGSSLGGVLAAFAAEELSKDTSPPNFLGAMLCAPAVGVSPEAVPSRVVVGALRAISSIASGLQTPFAPLEDPTQYECPSDSPRNFRGHWPLATSRMLLDVTAKKVPDAIKDGSLTFTKVPAVFIVSGENDEVVPFEDQVKFYESLKSPVKEFLPVAMAGHALALLPTEVSNVVHEKIFTWLKSRLS